MGQSRPIQSEELIVDEVFQPAIDSADKLTKKLEDLVVQLKTVYIESAKALKKPIKAETAEDVKKVTDALKQAEKARKDLSKAESALLKIRTEASKIKADAKEAKKTEAKIKAVKALTDAEKVKANLEAKASKDRIKQLEAEAILENAEIGREAKINANLTLLRLSRAKLTGAESDYLEQVEKINKAIDAENELLDTLSDKQKKNKANVGNYTESVKKAIDESELLNRAFGDMDDSSRVVVKGFGNLKEGLVGFTKSFKEAKGAGAKFSVAGLAGAGAALSLLNSAFQSATNTSREFEQKTAEVSANISNSFGATSVAIGNLFANFLIPKLDLFALKFEKTFNIGSTPKLDLDIKNAEKKLAEYKDGFADLGKNISEGSKEIAKQFEIKGKLQDITDFTNLEIANLEKKRDLQRSIASDGTQSFKTLLDANEKALKLDEQIIEKQIVIAKEKQRLAVSEARQQFINLNLGSKITDEQLRQLTFINDKKGEIAKKDELANKLGFATQTKLAEANIEVINKQKELEQAKKETEKELNQVKQDQLEKDLDILRDGFDNQKTNNLKIVADEKQTQTLRRELLEKTKVEGQKSFDQQQILLQTATKKKLDLQDLVNTSDAVELDNKIKLLELSEPLIQQTLDAIRDRRDAVSDLSEADRNLVQSVKDKNSRILESETAIVEDIIEIQQDENERLQKLEEDKQNASFLFRKKKLKELAKNEFDLQQELDDKRRTKEKADAERDIVEKDEKNAKLAEIDSKYDKQEDARRLDRIQKNKELDRQQFNDAVNKTNDLTQAGLQGIEDELDRRGQLQDQARDRQLQKTQTSIDLQNDLAIRGLDNRLADEEASLAKTELVKKEAQERLARQKEILQLTEAYFNALNARLTEVGGNPNTAPARALADVILGKAIGKGVAQFAAEGNNMIEGAGTETSDSIPFMLSKREAVIKASENIKHNDAVRALNAGTFDQNFMPRFDFENPKKQGNDIMVQMLLQSNNEMKQILLDIKNKPIQQIDVDGLGRIVETVYKTGSKTVTRHVNTRIRF